MPGRKLTHCKKETKPAVGVCTVTGALINERESRVRKDWDSVRAVNRLPVSHKE